MEAGQDRGQHQPAGAVADRGRQQAQLPWPCTGQPQVRQNPRQHREGGDTQCAAEKEGEHQWVVSTTGEVPGQRDRRRGSGGEGHQERRLADQEGLRRRTAQSHSAQLPAHAEHEQDQSELGEPVQHRQRLLREEPVCCPGAQPP